MTKLERPLLVFVLLATAALDIAPAQVSPAHFAVSEGNATALAIGQIGVGVRHLQVHEDLAGPITIAAIAFRPPARRAQSSASGTALVRLWMSHGANSVANLTANFAANHGPDKTLVLPRTSIVLAAPPSSGPVPRPFQYVLKLATPFTYSGNGPLCWEMEAFAGSATQQSPWFDAFDSPDFDPSSYNALRGSGCTASGQAQPMTLGPATANSARMFWLQKSARISLSCSNGPSLASGVLLFGLDYVETPLPGTGGGNSGLCSLHTAPLVTVPASFGATGSWQVSFSASLSASYHGRTLVSQIAGLDAAANAFGVVTSDTINVHFIAPVLTLPIGTVTGSAGSPTGRLGHHRGLIVDLQ